ncbi:MMPL family transporter, partial [Mycobacteroides abscessus]
PIVIGWVALVVILALAAPQLEQVGQENAVSLSPSDAPSMKAMKNMGRLFQESDSNSVTMIVLEGDQPLGPGAHKFYDE